MSAIEIKKVESRRDLCKFIDFHNELYKGNPYHVPNLYFDEMNTFRKDKNAAFDFCEAEYFMAYRDGKAVGRVAAIINHSANKKWGKPGALSGTWCYLSLEPSATLSFHKENSVIAEGLVPLRVPGLEFTGLGVLCFDCQLAGFLPQHCNE